jgi:hypothetical protein
LANLLRNRRRYAEAEPLYRNAIAILSSALGPDASISARAQRNLAMLMLATKLAEALPYAEAAFRAHNKAGSERSYSARTYAQVLAAVGKAEAIAITSASTAEMKALNEHNLPFNNPKTRNR